MEDALTEKVALESKPEGSEGVSVVWSGVSSPIRGHSQEASVAGVE